MDLLYSFYDYLWQHKDDSAWDAIHNDADLNRMKRVSADISGFSEIVSYLSYLDVNLSWVFDVFMDSWRRYYKIATGEDLY